MRGLARSGGGLSLVLGLVCVLIGAPKVWPAEPTGSAGPTGSPGTPTAVPDSPTAGSKVKPKDKPDKLKDASTTSALTAMTGGPGGAGGTSPFGTPVATQLDPFSGAMTATIPIAVPPGRKGMQPDVVLNYFSGSPNGWVGVGWRLEPGAIERQTKFGLDYTKDNYVLRMNGSSQELVQLSPGGTDFRAKIEGGFLRIKKLSSDGTSGWEVTDPRGTKYFFGRTSDARRADPQSPTTKIFTWLLDRVEDPHTNYVKYSYWTDSTDHEVYLDTITYTGHGTADGANLVRFYRESGRPDAPDLYLGHYRSRMTARLKAIGVYSNTSTLQRAYALNYSTSVSSGRSVLSSVAQYDRNASINSGTGAVSGTALPAVTFTYQAATPAFTPTSTVIPNDTSNPVCGLGQWWQGKCWLGYSNGSQRSFVADFNGDGKVDLLRSSDVAGENTLFISNGTTFTGYPTVIPNSGNCGIGQPWAGQCWLGYSNGSQRSLVGDFNGDGKADLLRSSDVAGENTLYISNGTSFTATPTVIPNSNNCGIGQSWQGNCWLGYSNGSQRSFVADFNGDGKADIVRSSDVSGENTLYLSNGTSFTAYPTVVPNSTANCGVGYTWVGNCYLGHSNGSQRTLVADFNGDGKADLLRSSDEANENTLYLSNDTSFTAYPSVISPAAGNTGGCGVGQSWAGNCWLGHSSGMQRSLVGDFNGDGKADIVRSSDVAGENTLFLSTGAGFVAIATPIPNSSNCGIGQSWQGNCWLGYSNGSQRSIVGDFNGDGKADILRSSDVEGENTLYISTGTSFTPYPTVAPNQPPGSPVCGLGQWWEGKCWLGYSNGSQRSFEADFNGDGKTDVLRSSDVEGENTLYEALAVGVGTDLLTVVENGIGGTTTIGYTPSTQYDNGGRLPYPVHVVSSLTTTDGNGNSATTTNSYSGGFHHIGERDFRGFHIVTTTGPAGPNGEQAVTETRFHQGNDVAVDVNNPDVPNGYMKGKPYRTKVTDGSGNVWSESTMAYGPDADGVAPWFTPPSQVVAFSCAGTGASCAGAKETKTEFIYDAWDATHHFTNLLQERQFGDSTNNNANASDDRTIVRTFSPNTTAWIISLPTTETIYQGVPAGTQKAQTLFYYDGTTSCDIASTNLSPSQGLLTRVVRKFSGATYSDPDTRMAYDSTYGVPTCVRDPRGNKTNTSYDSTMTFPVTVTNMLNHVTTTAYYGVNSVPMDAGLYGQVKSVTDPNNRTASMTYDAFGRASTSTAPNGLVTTTTYNNLGTVGSQHILTSRTVGGVNFQSWTYFDGLSRTIKAKSTGPQAPPAQNIVTQTLYNVRGQVAQSSLPFFEGGTPLWRTMTYDALGRVKTVTTPDGKVTTTCYDPWVTVVINPKSQKKRQVVDAYGRTVTVQEYTGSQACSASAGSPYAATSYAYDVLGNLTTVTDALGNQSTMTYDTLSRKTAIHDPDMGNWSYVYDEAGNLSQQTDAKGQNIYFRYDALNRRKQKDFGTQKADGAGDVVYKYDDYDSQTGYNRIGRLGQVIDSTGDVKFRYDVMGQINSSTRVLFGTTYTFSYTRDALGRLATVTYPDNSVITYTYDGPVAEKVKEGTTEYAFYETYNALGQPGKLTHSNGVISYFTYEANTFRLKSLQTTKPGGSVYQNLEYAYDEVGNVSGIMDFLTSANSQTFGYDALNRLLTAASNAYGTITYTYNEIGNLTSNSSLNPSTYTYPASGSSSVRPHAVSTAGSNSYTYDANGNMLTGAGRTFNSYDYENRPTSITSGGQTTTFVYDGDGGRVKKQTGSTVTWYISKLYECDTTQCYKYIWSGDRRIVSKKVSTGALFFYHGDHLGSASVVTDSTGTQVQALTYYPFGDTRTNVPGNPDVVHKYTGKELDATGLYWYEWRSYDPLLARFTTPDTIVPDPRDPQDLNRYSYVSNNPLKYTDPTGHLKWWKRLLIEIGIGSYPNTPAGGTAAGPASYTNPAGSGASTSYSNQNNLETANRYYWQSQTRAGRYLLAGEILIGSFAGAFLCGPCAGTGPAIAKGAFIGSSTTGALGGYSASENDGDISKGVLIGTAIGGVTGAIGGYVNAVFPAPTFAEYGWNASFGTKLGYYVGSNLISGSLINFGSGVVAGYAGGVGGFSSILQDGFRGVESGFGIEAGLTGLGLVWSGFAGTTFTNEYVRALDDSGNSVLVPRLTASLSTGTQWYSGIASHIQAIAASTVSPTDFFGVKRQR